MEKLIRNFGLQPRRFQHGLTLEKAGFIAGKSYPIRTVFQTINFSLLLDGEGWMNWRGTVYRLAAPCVFLQWPMEECDYGPEGCWDEMFFCYRRSDMKMLQQCNFYDESRPVWQFGNNGSLGGLLREAKEMLRLPEEMVAVDRMDRVAERIILETLLSRQETPLSAAERIVRQACVVLGDLNREITPDELAECFGISLPTLRRYWTAYMKVPLARFRSELVMQEACRMLVDTAEPIHIIAERLKFRDALYFSRKFSHENGMSPTRYRERFTMGK